MRSFIAFRVLRALLVVGTIAGFAHGFSTLHRRHEARRAVQLEELCAARHAR
jgi:hypothetical protein